MSEPVECFCGADVPSPRAEALLRERLAHDIATLLAVPPSPGAYRVDGRWYYGEGTNRVAIIRDAESLAAEVLALVRGEGAA